MPEPHYGHEVTPADNTAPVVPRLDEDFLSKIGIEPLAFDTSGALEIPIPKEWEELNVCNKYPNLDPRSNAAELVCRLERNYHDANSELTEIKKLAKNKHLGITQETIAKDAALHEHALDKCDFFTVIYRVMVENQANDEDMPEGTTPEDIIDFACNAKLGKLLERQRGTDQQKQELVDLVEEIRLAFKLDLYNTGPEAEPLQ
ncbi:MAG: hypothetical protein AAB462_01895 [Patescibacteria group bacterium]